MGTVTVMQVILVHSLRTESSVFIGLNTKPRMICLNYFLVFEFKKKEKLLLLHGYCVRMISSANN